MSEEKQEMENTDQEMNDQYVPESPQAAGRPADDEEPTSGDISSSEDAGGETSTSGVPSDVEGSQSTSGEVSNESSDESEEDSEETPQVSNKVERDPITGERKENSRGLHQYEGNAKE